MDPGPNLRFYQCLQAGLATVTSNGKSSYDVIIVCAYVFLSVLFTKDNITNEWPRSKVSNFCFTHFKAFVIELLIISEKLILFWVLKPFGMTAFPITANAFCVITLYIHLFT